MKKLFMSTCFIAALFTSSISSAQSLVISDEFGQSIASGKVVEMGIEQLTLQIGEDEFLTVDTEDVNLDDIVLDDLIKVGNHIKVVGEFDDSVLEAEEIIRLSNDSNIFIEAE